MPNSNSEPAVLTPELVARICGSLEPSGVGEGLRFACSELLGASRVRVFTFTGEDRAQIHTFGEEGESKVLPAPTLDGVRPFGPGESLIEPDVGGDGLAWGGALFPLEVDGETIGILEVSAERRIKFPEIVALASLGRALAVAVRNARTFEKARRLNFTDDLTALYNSRFMRLYLDRELRRCRRSRSSLSLLFMDLDAFKAVNDTFGHLAGSRSLVEVGEILEKTVRDADVLIRYGGDEFVIVCPETPQAGGLVIAEKIRLVISQTTFLRSMSIEARLSASIGVAAYPESANDVRALISSADQAMYQAKALGKDRVVGARPLSSPESI